jgi:hypothetical protein
MLVPAALAGLLGLAVYAYIPIAAAANPPLPYNHPTTWDGFVFLVTGEQFRGQFDFFSARGPGDFLASLGDLWTLLLPRGTAIPVVRRRRPGHLPVAADRVRPPACDILGSLYVWANYLCLEH